MENKRNILVIISDFFEKYIINPLNKFWNIITFKSKKTFDDPSDAYHHRPLYWIYTLLLIIVIFGCLIYSCIDVDFMGHISSSPSNIKMLFKGLAHPDWSLFFGYGSFNFSESTIYQIIETLAIAFIGTSISSILSLPFGFLASRKIVGKWAFISEFLLIIIRTFPELLFGLIIIKVVGFGAFTGVVVLSIHSIGMIGKMFAEQLDVISNEPLEALDACGASGLVRIKNGVIPQVAPNFLSVILYRFDLNVRTASLLGVVGAGGIGYSLWVYSAFNSWSQEASMIYGIIIMIVLIDILSSYLRKKLI
ncbi:MAG: phosphonate ABC transporter, permease protein PhnE [Mollicutes bacterium]|nr:phosphonate ABC transporter, permease protein PhnE [Mollicutes bacterium]MDD7263427.1 phosphonate ABC transporter, permease protein PhnE [bacterium]MDY4980038.1 phosphonate ABC transporter, permease protein PhnE [Candidatus Onthovivens sp.]